jgi:hypothetical protein
MNPDELVWRIQEAEAGLQILERHPSEDPCQLLRLRIAFLKDELAAEILNPTLEQARRRRPAQ